MKYVVNEATNCWEWTKKITRGGYGSFKIGSHHYSAHRIAYELMVGPIPEGLDIDHLCRVRHCVNPAHMEPVTRRENIRRGLTGHHNSDKTRCKHGHLFAEHAYVNSKGHRICRPCAKEGQRRFHAKHLAA